MAFFSFRNHDHYLETRFRLYVGYVVYLNHKLTPVTFQLEGVPVGQEDQMEKALDTYYLRG